MNFNIGETSLILERDYTVVSTRLKSFRSITKIPCVNKATDMNCTYGWIPKPTTVFQPISAIFCKSSGFGPGINIEAQVPEGYEWLDLLLIGGGGAGAVSNSRNQSPSILEFIGFIGAGGGGASGESLRSNSLIHIQPGSTITITLGAGSTSSSPGGDTIVTYTEFGGGETTVRAAGGGSGSGVLRIDNSCPQCYGQGNGGNGGSAHTAGGASGFTSSSTGGGGGGASIGSAITDFLSTGYNPLVIGMGGNQGLGTTSTGEPGGDSALLVKVSSEPRRCEILRIYGGDGGQGGSSPGHQGGTGGTSGTFNIMLYAATFPLSINEGQLFTSGGGGGGASVVAAGGNGGSNTRDEQNAPVYSIPEAGVDGSGGGGGLVYHVSNQSQQNSILYTPGGDGYVSFTLFRTSS